MAPCDIVSWLARNCFEYADELDFAMVREVFLVKGLEYLVEDEVRDPGRWAGTESAPEMLQFYNGLANVESVLNILEAMMAKYGRLFAFRHESQGKRRTITLNHRMGKNWSILLEENLKTIFARLGIGLQTEVTTNMVKASFVESLQNQS